jgi:hypothetical protein
MADQKISELTALTGANLADVDAFAVVDTSAVQTKKITYAELKTALDTGTGFVRITGDTMTGNLSFGDNNKVIFGAGSDATLHSDGTSGYARGFVLQNNAGNKDVLTFTDGGATTIFHNNSAKLATTSGGITVTGTVTVGNSSIGSNTSHLANITVNNNGYIGSASATTTLQIPTGGGLNVNGDLVVDTATNAKLTINDNVGEVGAGNLALQTTNSAGSALKPMGFRAEDIRFATGSDERVRITDTGVAIGTTSANAVLTTDPESGNFSSTYNNYDGVGLFIRGNGTSGNGNYGPALVFGSCDSDTVNQDHKHSAISVVQTDTDPNQTGLAFWTHPSATSTDALVEAMRIDASGNVGIGATSIDELLHLEKSSGTTIVKTEVAANSTIGFEIKKTNATTSNWRIVDGQTINGKLEIYDVTNSRNMMTFDQSGNVAIGGMINPTERFTVVNSSSGIVGRFTNNTNQTLDLGVISGSGAAGGVYYNSANSGYHAFQAGGSERARIASAGEIQIGGTTNAGFVDFDGTALQLNTQRNPNTGTFVNTSKSHAGISLVGGDADSHIKFYTKDSNNAVGTERVRIDKEGRVGIANDSPADFNASADDLVIGNSSQNSGITIRSGTSNSGNLFFADGTSGNQAYRGFVQYQHNEDRLVLGAAGDDQVWIYDNAVAIGNSDAWHRLQITGSGTTDGSIFLHNDNDTDHQYNGIIFKSDSTNTNVRKKAGIFFERTAIRGQGILHFCVEAGNNDTNASLSHSVFNTNGDNLTISDNKVLKMSSSSTSAAFMQMTDTGSTTYEMLFPSSSSIQLKTHTTSDRTLSLYNSGAGAFDLEVNGTGTFNYTTSSTNTMLSVLKVQAASSGTAVANHGGAIQFLGQRNDGAAQTLAQVGAIASTNSGSSIAGDLVFHTGSGGAPSEKMRLDDGGKLGVGTQDPQEEIHVMTGASSSIRASGQSNNNRKVEIGYDTADGPYLRGGSSGIVTLKFFIDNTVLAAKIADNADFYTNDGTVHSLSDIRVKTDVKDLDDGLDIVKQLKPRTFKYTADSEFYTESKKDEISYGFVANEVEEVAPQYTDTGKGKIGNKEVDDLKSLSTTKMIPMLVKAIQEQQELIESLTARITTLEG